MAEEMEPNLLHNLRRAVSPGDVLTTLSQGKPNRVIDISPAGVLIETDESEKADKGPQLVPAWMLNLGWRHLCREHSVTNSHLLTVHNLRRSSAVCTLLGALSDVEVASRRPIELRIREASP